MIDWGQSIFLFKLRQQEKGYCCLVAWPNFRSKTFFKRKQSRKTKQVEYCELFEPRSFGGEPLKIIQKQGRLFALIERRGELNPNGKTFLSDGERQQVCKIVRYHSLINSFSIKLFLCSSNILHRNNTLSTITMEKGHLIQKAFF